MADGLRTSLGSLTWPVIQQNVFDILTAGEHTITEAMFLVWQRMKLIIEPSSAVALAVIMENKKYFYNKNVAVILSGGNVDIKNLPWN